MTRSSRRKRRPYAWTGGAIGALAALITVIGTTGAALDAPPGHLVVITPTTPAPSPTPTPSATLDPTEPALPPTTEPTPSPSPSLRPTAEPSATPDPTPSPSPSTTPPPVTPTEPPTPSPSPTPTDPPEPPEYSLTSDGTNSAMFAVTNLVPGEEVSACVEVIYTGAVDGVSPIMLYSSLAPGASPIADYLEVTIDQGAGGRFGDCADFAGSSRVADHLPLTDLTANHSDFASGIATHIPTETRTHVSYRFTVTLSPATPDSLQGAAAGATFTWEVRAP